MDWTAVGGALGALGVGMGAFGAHGLKKRVQDAELLESWKTAAHYQMIHSAMVALSAAVQRGSAAPRLFGLGVLCFSGSIYGLVLLPKGNGLRKVLGPVTPLGGLLFIAGWIAMAFGKRK